MRVVLVLAFTLVACDPGPGPDRDELFDDTVLHRIELTIGSEALAGLTLENDARVSCDFSFDGIELRNVGVRLKGYIGSARSMDRKAGFSVKFDEFVEGQKLLGQKKLVINNEVQDGSFVSRRLSHELWRRAGVPAPRTAYAEVFVNGERFGLYVIQEATDKRFLAQHFDDPDGNLYEGDGRDVSSPNLDLDTNEDENDRSDLLALNDAVENLPAEGFAEAIDAFVDLEAFYRYWAVEALIFHFDGYGVVRASDGCCSPNNYYIYNDPARGRFVFLPHGADQVLFDIEYDVRTPPQSFATLASRLHADPAGRARLGRAISEVLDEAWDAEALEAVLDRVEAVILEGFTEGGREEVSQNELEELLAARRDFIRRRPAIVRAQLAGGF
jgi:hypothetical protein